MLACLAVPQLYSQESPTYHQPSPIKFSMGLKGPSLVSLENKDYGALQSLDMIPCIISGN